MFLLAFKLILAPILIALATLIGRRWGHGVSGWIAALPLTSGPVSLIFAIQYDAAFAAQAAIGTLAGVDSSRPFRFLQPFSPCSRIRSWARLPQFFPCAAF